MAIGLAVSLLALLLAAPSTREPLAPSGKWTVNDGPGKCVISREFGVAPNSVTLAILPSVLDLHPPIVLITPTRDQTDINAGRAPIKVGAVETSTTFESRVSAANKTRVTRIAVSADDMARIATSPTMTLPVTRTRSVTLPVKGLNAALAASKPCYDHLLDSWGVDRSALSRIVKPAEAISPEGWITYLDYPQQASRNDVQADTVLVWKVGEDGRVSSCRPTVSTNAKLFEDAACNAIMKRGRYVPAQDANGRAVPTWSARNVQWRLPVR